MTDPHAALTALICEHSGLTGVRAERLADKIAAEWALRRAVVDRETLRRVVQTALGCKEGPVQGDPRDEQPYALCESPAHVQTFHMGSCEFVDRLIGDILAAGVVTDAADVRRQTAEDIAAALEAGAWGYRRASREQLDAADIRANHMKADARIAREVGG